MKIALIGAGGKMGTRITNNLLKSGIDFDVFYVEVAEAGIERLREQGLNVTEQREAVSQADVIIMAVPDKAIETIAPDVVNDMQPDAMLMLLDPAAAYLQKVPKRDDVALFIAHPCHPPIFNDETSREAKNDFFGGVAAKQSVVCTLAYGSEVHYVRGEQLAGTIYAPVVRTHRLTLEQMAALEPAMAETVGATAALLLRDAMEEAVNKGVPREAAQDFMLGHLNILLAVAFGIAKNPLSDACLVAVEYGKQHLVKENWRELFTPESIKAQIEAMLRG